MTRSYCDRSLSALSPPLYSHRSHDSCIVRRLIASAPMRVHLYTLTAAPHVTSPHIAAIARRRVRRVRVASRHVTTRGAARRRGGTNARPTSRLPWRRVSPAPCYSCPRHHAITSHHMCPAEPSHAPRLVSGGGLLPLLRLLCLHRRLQLADGWGLRAHATREYTHGSGIGETVAQSRVVCARGLGGWAAWGGAEACARAHVGGAWAAAMAHRLCGAGGTALDASTRAPR